MEVLTAMDILEASLGIRPDEDGGIRGAFVVRLLEGLDIH